MTKSEELKAMLRQQSTISQPNIETPTMSKSQMLKQQLASNMVQPVPQVVTQPVVEPTPQVVTQPVQSTVSQPTYANHGAMAQQGLQQAQERLHATEKPMTQVTQNTNLPNSMNIASGIKQQAANAMPSFQDFQKEYNKGKNEANAELKEKGNNLKGRDIENYDKLLNQAQAEHNTKDTIKYTKLKEEAEKQVKESAKTASDSDYDLDFTSQSNKINMLGNEVQRNINLLNDLSNLGASQEELAGVYKNYESALKEYNEAVGKYYDNQYYDQYKNNNIVSDSAKSFGKNVLGGVANPINFGTAVGSKLIGNDATTINAEQLLQYNSGKGFNLNDVGRIIGSIIPSPATIINNATGRNEGPATAYAHLVTLAQTHPNSRKLQNLLSAISNHSYTGTVEDLKKDLDEAQKEMYQDFKNRTTQDDLNRVAEQTAHNERAYGNLAIVPNAFGTVGNMVPSMLMGYGVGGAAELAGLGSMATAGTAANTLQQVGSLGTLGLGAGGSAMDQAISNGASYNKAMEYGALKGATEAGTEVLGGETVNKALGRTGETVLGKVFGKAVNNLNIKSAVGQKLAKIGTDIAGEMTEEMISEALDPLWRQITYDNGAIKDYGTLQQWKDVFKAGLEAIPSTLIMQGGNVVLNKTAQIENGIINSLDKANISPEAKQALQQMVHEASEQTAAETQQNNQIATDSQALNQPIANEPITKMTTEKSLEDMRNFKEVGDKKVKAYQYENPEVKPFFQHEAKNMIQDLNNVVKGEKSATWNDYGELRYTGTKREATQDIVDLLDGNNGVKLSYDDIRKGLNAIIEDKGSENIAAAKRIEMVLDKRLREGYTDSYGDYYEPNENYLNFLAGKDFIEPAEYERQIAERMATENGTLFSLSEQEQQEVNDYINKINNDTTLDDNFKDQILNKFDNLTDYKQFENIKQEVDDYKDKAYKGISGIVDIANMKPEDVKQRPMEYTQRKDKNTPNQRRFFDNMETSNIIADETKNRVNATTYEVKHNIDTLQKMSQKLNERGNDLVEEWKHKTKNFTDNDVALGAVLLERYQQNGDFESAARTVEKLADMSTESARALQMYSIWQRLSPETMQLFAQRQLNEAFEEMKQRKTGKWVEANKDKFRLTAEDTQFIYDQVEKASQAIDEETKQRELSKIENRINDKLPPEDGQAIKALRRIAMLFNPKTQVRNFAGNTLIIPVNDIADVVGAGIDRLVAKKTGVRTTGLPNVKAKTEGAWREIKALIKDAKTGTRTSSIGDKWEFETQAKPFNEHTNSKTRNAVNKFLNNINDSLSLIMSGGDRPFYGAAYENSLQNQMKLNNVTEATEEMKEIARQEGKQRTWNDDNQYTKTVLAIRRAMNIVNVHGFGLGDLIIPFAKTPANLTKAMVEYSPAGFIPAISNYVDMNRAISRGEMTPQQQKKFVSSMSKAIAGSILYAIAGSLVKAGKITGSADDDKDVKNFEQNVLGIQPYSVRLGDKTYTYSWANPINAPLAIMADSYKMSKEDAKLYDQLYNAVKVAGNVLLDNSFLQGISDIFTHQEGPVAGIIESIMSMPESMIPTFLSQIASLGDDTQRQTYEYKNKGQSVINRVKNKIPGARNTLEPKVNTFGEEIENQNNLFNAFLNPANVREARTTEAQKEIYSLYEATGDKTIFPMQAPNSVTKNGDTENLTNKQKVRYQKGSGQYATEVYEPLFKSDYYDSISNDKKVELLATVSQDANKMGKTEVGVWTKDTFKVDERYNELEDRGIPLADYYIAWSAQKDVTSDKDANGKTIKYSASNNKKDAIDKAVKGLNKKQMEYLYGIFDISEKVW